MAKVLCKKCNMVSEYYFTDLNGKIESEIVCDKCLPEVENHHVKNLSKFATPDNEVVASYSKCGFIDKFDHEDGSLIVSFEVTQEREMEEIVKKWIPNMKVVEPLSLKNKIEAELKKYLNIN